MPSMISYYLGDKVQTLNLALPELCKRHFFLKNILHFLIALYIHRGCFRHTLTCGFSLNGISSSGFSLGFKDSPCGAGDRIQGLVHAKHILYQ